MTSAWARLISRKLAVVVLTLWPLLCTVGALAKWGADAETLRTLATAVLAVVGLGVPALVVMQGWADVTERRIQAGGQRPQNGDPT